MTTIPFSKYEGLGNDFVLVDLRQVADAAAAPILAPEAVRRVCDRRFGIGADGILPLLPAATAGADLRLRVLNADGSEAEMCGNGIRCVAKHVFDTAGERRRRELRVETLAGLLDCRVETLRDGRAETVAVEMGAPRLRAAEIPLLIEGLDGPVVRQPIEADGRRFTFTAVSMGNPHAVLFVDEGEELLAIARRYGPSIERHALFPRRTNTEIARLRRSDDAAPLATRAPGSEPVAESRRAIDLVVYERGCGITLACGTGACATAVAAVLEERAKEDEEIAVHLPGGTLYILVHAGLAGVRMRGPATLVYHGQLDLAELSARPLPASAAAAIG